jgi:hypothetical protein
MLYKTHKQHTFKFFVILNQITIERVEQRLVHVHHVGGGDRAGPLDLLHHPPPHRALLATPSRSRQRLGLRRTQRRTRTRTRSRTWIWKQTRIRIWLCKRRRLHSKQHNSKVIFLCIKSFYCLLIVLQQQIVLYNKVKRLM